MKWPDEVLTGSRLLRQLLIAAFRKSREDRAEEGYPNAFEARLARHQAEEQFGELKRLSPRSRLAVVRLNPEYQSWALVERCCEAAVEEGSRDLKQSAAWARLALAIAKWVRGPEGWQRRLRGYALAHWANLYESAIGTQLQAAPLIERRGDRRLWYKHRSSLAVSFCHVGRYEEAAELVKQTRRLAAELGDKIDLIRLKWLEGRIQAGLGRREEALRLLAEAREGFEAEGMFYEESTLLLEENRTREVKELTRELPKVFAAQGVHREALAADLADEAEEKYLVRIGFCSRLHRHEFLERRRRTFAFQIEDLLIQHVDPLHEKAQPQP